MIDTTTKLLHAALSLDDNTGPTGRLNLLESQLPVPCVGKHEQVTVRKNNTTVQSIEGLDWSMGRRNSRIINRCVAGRDLTGKLTNESHTLKLGHELVLSTKTTAVPGVNLGYFEILVV